MQVIKAKIRRAGKRRAFPAGVAALATLVLVAPVAVAAAPLAATALPGGATLVAGQASISQNGNRLNIVQGSETAILNWSAFNIGSAATVNFQQPAATSATLNRVTGNDPSVLLGALTSNGKVWLINPAGILVGPGARIDVAGFVASTLNVRDEDFLARRLTFQGGADAANAGIVQNFGAISTPQGGSVYLVGPLVENHGLISAPGGEVLLAAGRSVQLFDTGTPGVKVEITGAQGDVSNLGQIISKAGRIGLAGVLLKNSGVLDASSVSREGGRIFLQATARIELADSSRIAADGARGGQIAVIAVENGALAGTLQARGVLSAQGDGSSGSGGFIETSAARVDLSGVRVQTGGGNWLIDPANFNIAVGGDMDGATLSANLGHGNVQIQSNNGASGTAGDINVNDAVAWSANKLTLSAQGNINVNAAMNGSGSASLALEYGQGALAAGNPGNYIVAAALNLPAGPNFRTRLGSDGLATNYTVITSLGAAASSSGTDLQGMGGNLAGHYALGADIDALASGLWNGDAGFLPIGTFTGPFSGTFDGLGHTIANLTIKRPATDSVGLFAAVDTASVVRNVGLVGASVSGHSGVGALVGGNAGSIANSYATGTVTGSGSGSGAGGLVGGNAGSISNSYAAANVSGTGSYIGGLTGGSSGSIVNSYATGTVSGSGSKVGGLAGFNSGSISNSYAAAVSSTAHSGALVGLNSGTLRNSFWNSDLVMSGIGAGLASGATGLTSAQMQTRLAFAGWDFTNTWQIAEGQTYPSLLAIHAPSNIWTGAVNNAWLAPGNWSLGHVPNSTESVVIPDVASSAFVELGAGAQTVKSLSSSEFFKLDGAGTSFVLTRGGSFNAGLSMAAGTSLSANGMLLIGGVNGVDLAGLLVANAGLQASIGAGFQLGGSINASSVLLRGNGITLLSGATINASAASGDSIVLDAGSANFTNASGSATPFTLAGSARSLLYSASSAAAGLGGLGARPVYGKSFATYAPGAVTQAGNRILYADPGTPYVVTVANASRMYGDANPVFGVGAIVAQAFDSISGGALLSTLANAGSNVGSYAIGAAQGSLVSDANLGFTFVAGTLGIVARPLGVVAQAEAKVYGAPDPLLAYTAGALLNGDALSGSLARSGGENVGSHAIHQGTLSAGANYALSFVGNALTIAPAAGGAVASTDATTQSIVAASNSAANTAALGAASRAPAAAAGHPGATGARPTDPDGTVGGGAGEFGGNPGDAAPSTTTASGATPAAEPGSAAAKSPPACS